MPNARLSRLALPVALLSALALLAALPAIPVLAGPPLQAARPFRCDAQPAPANRDAVPQACSECISTWYRRGRRPAAQAYTDPVFPGGVQKVNATRLYGLPYHRL